MAGQPLGQAALDGLHLGSWYWLVHYNSHSEEPLEGCGRGECCTKLQSCSHAIVYTHAFVELFCACGCVRVYVFVSIFACLCGGTRTCMHV